MKRADSKIGRLRTELLKLLSEHEQSGALPTSARFLFYELVQRGVLSKSKTGARRPDQDMSDALTDLREDGDISWEWIVDETRSIDVWSVALTVKDWLIDATDRARIDPWDGEAPIIITESRSLGGVLRDLAYTYAVPITATNGQVGGFLHTTIAPMLRENHRVIYLGDFDLAGGQIETNTRAVLERKVGALRRERLALTQEQIEQYDLPRIIKHDRRFADGGQHEAVETEALSQTVLVGLLRARLNELLPEPLERVQEEAQRAHMRSILEESE